MACPLPGHEGDSEHSDGSGSFTVNSHNDLFKCFGCGGSGNTLTLWRILSRGQSTGPNIHPRTSNPQPKKKKVQKEWQPLQGVTVEQLVRARGLDLAYVCDVLGWADTDYYGTPAILIPYRDEKNNPIQSRYRVGLNSGNRFLWEKGAKTMPYGVLMLENHRAQHLDYIIIVEDETDFATLAYRGYPVLAVPGASTFQPTWASYLRGFEFVYLWVEHDTGGDALKDKLLTFFPNLKLIDAPDNAKDPTELASLCEDFEQVFRSLLDSAQLVHGDGLANAKSRQEPSSLYAGRTQRRWSGGHWVKTVSV